MNMSHTSMLRRCLAISMACALLLLSSGASALTPSDDSTPDKLNSVNFGLNLRTDLGAHPLRFDLGFRTKRTDYVLVLDPMFWTDGQSSTDFLFGWRFTNHVQPIAGWRLNTIRLPEGRQLQQNLLLGVALDLPTFWRNRLRGQWGFELAMTLVKHGGGLPSETISFASARSYLDLMNFGMFARFDFHVPLFWEKAS